MLKGMSRPPAWLPTDLPLLDARCPLPLGEPFAARDAHGWGVSSKVLRTLVRRGLVREVVRGAYAVMQLPDTIEVRAAALRLVVSEGAVVTDRTAAWLHGLDVLPRSAIHEPVPLDVFSATESRLRRGGIHSGIRELRDRDLSIVDGVLVTTPVRTALDLGRLLRRYDAIGALDGFLRLGVEREELDADLGRFKGYRGVVQLRELVPLADGRAESVPESALRLHAHDADLPPLVPQVWVDGVFRIDLARPELRYGAEYHGVAFHTGPEHEREDRERADWLDRRGWVIDDFWKDDLYGPTAHPAAIMRAGLHRARERLGAWRPQGRFLRNEVPGRPGL